MIFPSVLSDFWQLRDAVIQRNSRRVPSAVDILPTEVMGQIFMYFVTSGNPLVVCWVSRRWRRIGMSMVELWIHPIFIVGPASFASLLDLDCVNSKMSQSVKEMCHWMDRAHSSSSVSLTLHPGPNHRHVWKEPLLLDFLIKPYAQSFRSLDLDITQEQLSPLFDGRSHFPHLQSLSLHIPCLDLSVWLWYKGLTASAPLLHHLKISASVSRGSPAFSGFTTSFPWNRLITLDMEDALLDEGVWCDIMHQCNSLQTGSFTVQPDPSYTSKHFVVFHYLTSLHIKFRPRFQPPTDAGIFDVKIFDSLSFPALEVLHIAAQVDWSDALSFVQWMQRQSVRLRSLTLEVRLPNSLLFEILRIFPNLEKLGLYLRYGDVSECKAVFQSIQESRMQKLRVLEICSGFATYTPGSVRRTRYSTLKNIVFDLVKTITTWAISSHTPGGEFHLFADGEVLSGVRTHLFAANNSLCAISHVVHPLRGQGNDEWRGIELGLHPDITNGGWQHTLEEAGARRYASAPRGGAHWCTQVLSRVVRELDVRVGTRDAGQAAHAGTQRVRTPRAWGYDTLCVPSGYERLAQRQGPVEYERLARGLCCVARDFDGLRSRGRYASAPRNWCTSGTRVSHGRCGTSRKSDVRRSHGLVLCEPVFAFARVGGVMLWRRCPSCDIARGGQWATEAQPGAAIRLAAAAALNGRYPLDASQHGVRASSCARAALPAVGACAWRRGRGRCRGGDAWWCTGTDAGRSGHAGAGRSYAWGAGAHEGSSTTRQMCSARRAGNRGAEGGKAWRAAVERGGDEPSTPYNACQRVPPPAKLRVNLWEIVYSTISMSSCPPCLCVRGVQEYQEH
ncbi:hypothetical protein B0H11DRAFT_2417790 [Mycena galericulata]|nr:hypothetical protein B0H11DRAFT_2417790 [Mycena galericulata]